MQLLQENNWKKWESKSIWRFQKKEKWKEIIAYANRVGAINCNNYGAIDSIPTEKDLEG